MPVTRRLSQLTSGVIQDERIRMPARLAGAALLEIRGLATEHHGRRRPLRNVYGASMWKAGSQWAKALFDHEIVADATGLATYPQAVFNGRGLRNRFPAHCYVQLYLSYPDYAGLLKRPPYRAFYVARDPRDIVVSWYFSMRDTHRELGRVPDLRRELRTLSFSDGLLFSIEDLAPSLNAMSTWLAAPSEEVAFFRLEEIRDDPEAETRRLLSHCQVSLSDAQLDRVLRDTSREALRSKDLAARSMGGESHYRQEPSTHMKHFGPEHHERFRELTGDLVEQLGYA